MQNKAGNIKLSFNRNDPFTTSASINIGVGGADEISVKAIPLKQLMADFGLSKIDFLKLDCEGSEYDIIYHCEDALLDSINLIAVETHRGKEASESKDALCEYLRAKNFQVDTKLGSDMVYAHH